MSIEITGKSVDEDFQELKKRLEVILAILNPFHVHHSCILVLLI